MILSLAFSFLFLAAVTSARPNAPKVNLALYYESLCPDCREFILHQLYPTYEKVNEIFNLTLVPYGNAYETKHGDQWKFDCQHGKLECVGNVIETCALHFLKNMSASIRFVYCFEKDIVHGEETKDPLTVAEKCAEELRIDFDPIKDCQAGHLGNMLEHEMAKKTDAATTPVRPLGHAKWETHRKNPRQSRRQLIEAVV